EQIAAAFADWVAAECRARPLLLVLEDLQWGDALSLQLVQDALREHEQGALFVLALARPEVEESFPKLLADQRSLSLTLQPLGARACELFVREVLGDQVDAERLARMTRLAAGNALFLEELVRAAAEGKSSDVPETVLAVLQARLSRLSPEARQLL